MRRLVRERRIMLRPLSSPMTRPTKSKSGGMVMFFGARTPGSLPYFGPLKKVPKALLDSHFVYSRTGEKEYVQDRMMVEQEEIADTQDWKQQFGRE